jgi:hypothetical protein
MMSVILLADAYVGLVEYVLDLREEGCVVEVIARDLGVIVNVEVDEAVARRLQQVFFSM